MFLLSINHILIHLSNKAVYTAISVACGCAGAVVSLCKPQNSKIRDQKLVDTDRLTHGQTNVPTDGPANLASYRVACTRLKMDAKYRVFLLKWISDSLYISAFRKYGTLLMIAFDSPWKAIFYELLIFVLQSCLLLRTYAQLKKWNPNQDKKEKKCYFQKRGAEPYNASDSILWTAALKPWLHERRLQST